MSTCAPGPLPAASQRHPAVAVTVDVLLLTVRNGRLCILLVQRANPPFEGCWALPGGFVEVDEDLEDAAYRELAEETGLQDLPASMYLEQLKTYGAPDRDPRMRVVSVAYVAMAPDLPVPRPGSDARIARFWAVNDLEGPDGLRLAFDHRLIVADGVERARSKLEYTTLGAAFLEEPFTLTELRRIYEEVWGVRLDPSNFRRKVLSIPGFVTPLGEQATASTSGRPPELYRRGEARILWPPLKRPSGDEPPSPGEED